MLEPYTTKGEDQLAVADKAADGKWFAATGYMAAFCVNTEVLKAKNLPVPTTWKELADPKYKGVITSYSIHYTKLYDDSPAVNWKVAFPSTRGRRWADFPRR